MSKRFMKLVCVLLSLIMLLGTTPMSVFAEMIPDESGVYLIGTAEELFAFAELAKTTAEADKAAGNTRTALSAKLHRNTVSGLILCFFTQQRKGLPVRFAHSSCAAKRPPAAQKGSASGTASSA